MLPVAEITMHRTEVTKMEEQARTEDAATPVEGTGRWSPAPGTAGVSQRVPADRVEEDEEAVDLDVLEFEAMRVCYVNQY